MPLKFEKVCLTNFMLLPFLCLVFSAFPVLQKFLSLLQVYRLVLLSRVCTGATDAVCGAPLNPKSQVSPPATSQLRAEPRGGWTTLRHPPCAGLGEGAGGQLEVQCATLVFPNWAVRGPPPWEPFAGHSES